MRSPLFFFILIFAIDIILKSAKNKKKVEQARVKRRAEIKPVESKGQSIMKTIREEIEKEIQKESGKRTVKQPLYKEEQQAIYKNSMETMKEAEIRKKTQWQEDSYTVAPAELGKKEVKRENSLQNDLIRGIIFSEILSEPKSIKNQRKSM